MKMKILVLFIALVMVASNIFPIMHSNDSETAYLVNVSSQRLTTDQNMRQLIIESAGFIISSQSNYFNFLNEVELSELTEADYSGLQLELNSCISNMQSYLDIYEQLISSAKSRAYNQTVITELLAFDYANFQTNNSLNHEIFSVVADYLGRGDVTGILIQLKSNMYIVYEKLVNIKADVDLEIFPKISLLWIINQEFNDSMLLGQYLAEVFYDIKRD